MSVIRGQISGLREKAVRYLAANWGSPFIIAFIILLAASGIILSAGQSEIANTVAVYVFYALGLGVVLQVASCAMYCEGGLKEKEPLILRAIAWHQGKKTLGLIITVILLIAVLGAILYSLSSFSILTSQ